MADKSTLIVGPARSEKTARLLDRYRESLHKCSIDGPSKGSAIWIGPSSSAVAQLRDRLIESSNNAYLGVQIVTFAGFADSLVASSQRRVRPIKRIQKRRILRFLNEQSIKNSRLKHFSRVAGTPGFIAQIDELIAELKRQDIWPEHFSKHCRQSRDHDLAAIYDLYQQFLNENDLYDAEGRFWEARRHLAAQVNNDSRTKYRLIVVDGFSDFTSAQYDILELLSNQSAEICFSLSMDPETLQAENSRKDGRSLLFLKTKTSYQRLKQKLPDLEVEVCAPQHSTQPALGHFSENLFIDPNSLKPPPNSTTGIEILAASGVHSEVEEIARRIKALLHEKSARPHEIVVVTRSLGDVAGRLAEVFDQHELPYSMPQWQLLASSPVFRSLLSLLRLHDADWPFRQLLSVVGNRMIRLFDSQGEDTEGISTDARIAMESCVRSAQLPSGKRALLEQLQRRVAAAQISDSMTVENENPTNSRKDQDRSKRSLQAQLASEKLDALDATLGRLPGQASLGDWITHLEQLALGLNIFPDKNEITESINSSDLKYSKIMSDWNCLQAELSSLEKVEQWTRTDSATISVSNLIELLETIGRETQLPAGSDEVGRVRILNAESARHVSAKYVFLAGLSEQSFSSSETTDSLYSVSDLQIARQQSEGQGNMPSTQQARAGDEMLLFYELATRATEHLTLSYPSLDDKGQLLSPSPMLVELEQCFGETELPKTSMSLGEASSPDTQSSKPWSAAAFRQQAINMALDGKPNWLAGLASKPESAQLSRSLLDSIRCVSQRGERGVFTQHDGLLQSDRAQSVLAQRFDHSHLWSPSQLEGYATCPFRFFSEQILSIEPPSELTLSSDARRRGSLLHEVLATLHQHLADASLDELQSQLVSRFLDLLDKAVASAPLEGLQQWLREIERREIEAWAEQYSQQELNYRGKWDHLDEPLRPNLFEIRFGPQVKSSEGASDDSASTAVPFELDLGPEKILLTGQIDRVDMGRVGSTTVFNIIDYKSGTEVKLREDKISSGRQLQLPLYAMAAEHHLLTDHKAVALSTGYWSIQGSGFGGKKSNALEIRELSEQGIKESSQWEQLQPVILERIAQLISGIRSGNFPVLNEDENCTRSCDFNTICRVAQVRSLDKVMEDTEKMQRIK